MKNITILALFLTAACGDKSPQTNNGFKRILPDTLKSWSGKMTREDFHLTRKLERKFNLGSLWDGVTNEEIRLWILYGSYDPQTLLILTKLNSDSWSLRKLSFYQIEGYNIHSDFTRSISNYLVDSLNLGRYWSLASQSDLKAGDSYGCMDGENVFFEIADSTKYRFMWFRCPGIHKNKNLAFLMISELQHQLEDLVLKQ
jgi:hypothetical protein